MIVWSIRKKKILLFLTFPENLFPWIVTTLQTPYFRNSLTSGRAAVEINWLYFKKADDMPVVHAKSSLVWCKRSQSGASLNLRNKCWHFTTMTCPTGLCYCPVTESKATGGTDVFTAYWNTHRKLGSCHQDTWFCKASACWTAEFMETPFYFLLCFLSSACTQYIIIQNNCDEKYNYLTKYKA